MANFFNKQDNLTAAKITIYKEYLTNYLPKILQTYNTCLIADLFCGSGKNGDQDGSPLVLLERAKYILNSPVVNRENPNIEIVFNDLEKKNIDSLNEHLSGFSHQAIKISSHQNIKH